jgi:hypothetical protein
MIQPSKTSLLVDSGMYILPSAINFITVLRAHFLYKILAPKITELKCNQRKLSDLLLYKKGAHKMLVRLTPG